MLFDIRPAVAWLTDRQRGQQAGGQKAFVGENPPRGAAISYYLKSRAVGRREDHDRRRHRADHPHARRHEAQGINRVIWNLTPTPAGGRGREGAAVADAAAAPASSPAPTS